MGNHEQPVEKHGAGTYEMLWNCRFCGTEKLLGVTHRHCPTCGAAQDPAWRYYPAEEDMVALEDHQFVGADKMCPACGQPNSAANAYCAACGADMATGEVVAKQGTRDLGIGIADKDTRHDVVKEKFEADMARVEAEERAKPVFLGLTKTQLWIVGGVTLAVAIIAAIIFAVTYRRKVGAEVEALTWKCVVEIEEFQEGAGEGWADEVPDGADMQCERRKRETERIQVGSHEECKDIDSADGSMKRECEQVPDYEERDVYDEWCTYDWWVHDHDETTSGEGKTPEPRCPDPALDERDGYGRERVGQRTETYTVTVRDSKGEKHRCEFDQKSDWEKFDVGMEVKLKVNITGGADCDTLTVAQ